MEEKRAKTAVQRKTCAKQQEKKRVPGGIVISREVRLKAIGVADLRVVKMVK